MADAEKKEVFNLGPQVEETSEPLLPDNDRSPQEVEKPVENSAINPFALAEEARKEAAIEQAKTREAQKQWLNQIDANRRIKWEIASNSMKMFFIGIGAGMASKFIYRVVTEGKRK